MHEIPENDRPIDPAAGEQPTAGVPRVPASSPRQLEDAELLSAYLDGELRESDREQVESLLEERPELGQLLEELRTVRGTLASLPRVELEADFYQQVLHQVEREMLAGGQDATREEAPTLSASTLPAITLSLPPPDKGESSACEAHTVVPGSGGPEGLAGTVRGSASVDRVAETMPTAGEMWKTPMQPANAPLPTPQARGPGETERGSPADGRRVKWLSAVRSPRAWKIIAAAGGLAAMLLVAVFWGTHRQAPELAQGPAALPGDAPHARRAMRESPAAPAGRDAVRDLANRAPDDGVAEKVAEAAAVPGPGGAGAVDAKPWLSEERAGRRGSEAARPPSSAREPLPEEEGSPAAADGEALGEGVLQKSGREFVLEEAAGALVVHCELASNGASFQAFREVLQGADIAWSDSDVGQLEELLAKLAPRFQGADGPHAPPDDESDQAAARQEAQPATQQKQASASASPPFEVWYVAARPEQVAAVLAAMAQQPEVFRHAQVLAGGGESVPLQEWQQALAANGLGEAEALRQGRAADKRKRDGDRFSKRRSRAQAARSGFQGEPQQAPGQPREKVAQEESPPAPADQAGADSGEAPADPAQGKNGAATPPAGEDKAPADEGEEGVAGEEMLEELPSGLVGGGLGGAGGGPERLDGQSDEGPPMAYAVRWNIGAPDLAEAVQQLLGKLVPLVGDLMPQTAAPAAPVAPLPAAPQAADKLEDAESPDSSEQPPSGDVPEQPSAAEPDEPSGVPDSEAEGRPSRKSSSGEADSARQASGGTEGRRAEASGAKGKRSRGSRQGGEPSHDTGAAQMPAGAESLSANGLPKQQGADPADRAADKDQGAPAGPQTRASTGYQHVLFVLRIVPAEPATADEAE